MDQLEKFIFESQKRRAGNSKEGELYFSDEPYEEWIKMTKKQGYYTIPEIDNMPPIDIFIPGGKKEERVHLHNHSFFEMVYAYKGDFKYYTKTKEYVLKQGAVVLLSPNTIHCVIPATDDACLINILIKKSFMESNVTSLLIKNSPATKLVLDYFDQNKEGLSGIYIPKITKSSIDTVIKKIVEELNTEDEYMHTTLNSAVIELFITIARCYKSFREGQSLQIDGYTLYKKEEQQMADILKLIDDNAATVTLNDLAMKYHYSISQISRMIQKHTGKSFSNLVIRSKLKRAEQYLTATNMSMNEIAESVGYNDSSYLYHVFKEEYGVSPSKYRKSNMSLK